MGDLHHDHMNKNSTPAGKQSGNPGIKYFLEFMQEYKSNDFGYHKTKVAQLLTVAREQELTEHPAGSSNRALRSLEKCADPCTEHHRACK